MLARVGELERAVAKSFHEGHHEDDSSDLLSHHSEMKAADGFPVLDWAVGVIAREGIIGSGSGGGKCVAAAEEWKRHCWEAELTTVGIELHGIVIELDFSLD